MIEPVLGTESRNQMRWPTDEGPTGGPYGLDQASVGRKRLTFMRNASRFSLADDLGRIEACAVAMAFATLPFGHVCDSIVFRRS